MGDVSGSIRKVILDSVTYDVMGDANITEVGGAFENEAIPTSGRTIFKMTKRPENREGVVIACNGAERELLKELSERFTVFSLSYQTAAGDIYRTVGKIEFENRETEENRATIQLLPDGPWEAFLAA